MAIKNGFKKTAYVPPRLKINVNVLTVKRNAKKFFELTCNFYTVSGWKEHSSQQKPMKPGMAKNKLKDILK